jgi:hypothetical protein
MKRFRWVALGLIAFLILGSFSISLPSTFELVDASGAPHTTAYIAYLYEGGRPNPVHPTTDPITAVATLELISHFRQEYDAFLACYGSVPRPMGGQLISRTLGGELKALGDLARALAQQ